MVIDEPRRLHKRVADRWSNEPKTLRAQVRAHRFRFVGLRWYRLHGLPGVLDRPTTHEAPNVAIKAVGLLDQRKESLRVTDCSMDLCSVADDERRAQEL